MTPEEARQRIINVHELGVDCDLLSKDEYEFHKVLLEALEKQIPKKPLNRSNEYDGEYGYCPCCNKVVADYDSNNVCRFCGQALDWS